MTAVGVSAAGVAPATRSARFSWGGVSGIVFGPLLAGSALMTAGMPQADNADKVQAWVVKHTGLFDGAALVSVAGVIIGLCFLTWLYSRLAGRETGWMGSLYLVGVVVFAMAGTVIAGINATIGSDAKHLTTGSLQLMASLDMNFNYGMTCIGLAVMYLAAGHLIRRSTLLPGWLAWVSWLFAVLAASYFLGFVALLGTVLWSLVIAILLMTRRPAES